MNKNKPSRHSYTYKPESITEGDIDWVTFTEPDQFIIKRTLLNGGNISCTTNIIISSRHGNAWSAGDLIEAITKKSVQKVLKSKINQIRLNTTIGDEGQVQPFIFKWLNKTLTILPPDNRDVETPKADKDAAGLVYVLTKVYKQQLSRPECNLLNKLE